MKITYIYHSCYVVEFEDKVLIFDYYKNKLPNIAPNKKIYFFVSHSHYDHFNESIFDLYTDHDVKFIVSSDCFVPMRDNVYTMLIDDYIEVDGMKIKTLRSTDLGVAYLVYVNGKCIYHAGDLNCWTFEENKIEDNEFMEYIYSKEMDKLKDESIDVAFVPLDSRLKSNALLGIKLLLEKNQPKYLFPMHMWNDFSIVDIASKELQYKGFINVICNNFVYVIEDN